MRIISLPHTLGFKNHDLHDFDPVLAVFDWTIHDTNVIIDMRKCHRANYQALALLVPYVWHLKLNNCNVDFSFDPREGASRMWLYMGARGWSQVLYEPAQNFKGHEFKPLIAIRNQMDFGSALTRAEEYTTGFNVEYEKTLRYVVSELLYNTIEHGRRHYESHGRTYLCPSIIQFTWYRNRDEISLIIADLGVGIKSHLERTYPVFESDAEAIRYAIKPNVSGTFGMTGSYAAKNNAGVGLYISSNIVQRLHADMFIVSGNGLLHISPRDTTAKTLASAWPGTLVLVTIRLSRKDISVNLHQMMAEFREAAQREIARSDIRDLVGRFDLNVENYFGRYAENKEEAIRFRDRHLLPAVDDGKTILLDFGNVVSSPHSFLSALLAIPIQRLGMPAYKRIKVTNAVPEIRETIDFILDENTAAPSPDSNVE